MKKQGSELYTRRIYKKSLEQLQRTTTYEREELEKMELTRSLKYKILCSRMLQGHHFSWKLMFQSLLVLANANCMSLVFLHLKINQIPEHYTMKRRTRMAKKEWFEFHQKIMLIVENQKACDLIICVRICSFLQQKVLHMLRNLWYVHACDKERYSWSHQA